MLSFRKGYLFLFIFADFINGYGQVHLKSVDNEASFWVQGNAYSVKGVTFGYDEDSENYDRYFQELQYLGVNTIRTWGTGENTPILLDKADKYNIKVLLGIWMRHGRPGMEADDRFDYLSDAAGKKAMLENAKKVVETYKDHPAVLGWGVGNEVYLNTETDEEKVAYSKFLQEVCSTIKTIDDKHPIGSICAWTFGVKWWEQYVPSLDFYGINVYGFAASILPEELKKEGATKPYVITEFGVRGEWDQPKDENGITIEPGDSSKYKTIVTGYREWIEPEPSCLGLFVFHYSNDDRFLSPWLLTHHRGLKRPQYWAVREAYTGKKPENYVPVISHFALPEKKVEAGQWVPVSLSINEFENEPFEVRFFYNQRLGSRKRRDQITPLSVRGSAESGFEIQVPEEKEGIKVYVEVSDSYGNVGISTGSLFIDSKKPLDERTLVPRASLPFYVYKEGDELSYVPSGYMGDYEKLTVDTKWDGAFEGEYALKIHFASNKGWYGLALVDPAGDWGDLIGGYNLTGATEFSFYAKCSIDGHKATVGYGLIKKDKPFPDSSRKEMEIILSNKWKKYTIKIKKADMRFIRSGFVIFSAADIVSHSIYIDEVVFK